MMLKWCFHKKILRNISQNLLQEFSCTLHKTTANTGFFFTLFSRIHGVLIQWIRENYSKNIQKLYSIVFCPNTGKCGAKKPAFTVVLCSGSLSSFYLWHNKETIILHLHFICKFIEPFLSKPFFLLWNSMFYSLLPELLYDSLFLETIQKSGSFDYNFLTYSLLSQNVCKQTFHISHVGMLQKVKCVTMWSLLHIIFMWRRNTFKVTINQGYAVWKRQKPKITQQATQVVYIHIIFLQCMKEIQLQKKNLMWH